MRYHVIHIKTSFAEEWQQDLFNQQLCDLGVDTIDPGSEPELAGSSDYYIPSDIWLQNQTVITEYLSSFRFLFSVDEVPDENWNAAWEAEHPVQELLLGVKIIPHCAFGAGYHETTSMMIGELLNTCLEGKTVLDNGCGTGVLGIFAKKQGAQEVIAIDIDDKSVRNTLENAALNGVEIDSRLGDLSSFNFPLSPFNLILANIHRNILLAQMPLYARCLVPGGELWMSGFYESDLPSLQSAAGQENLTVTGVLANGEWRLMKCRKEERHSGTQCSWN